MMNDSIRFFLPFNLSDGSSLDGMDIRYWSKGWLPFMKVLYALFGAFLWSLVVLKWDGWREPTKTRTRVPWWGQHTSFLYTEIIFTRVRHLLFFGASIRIHCVRCCTAQGGRAGIFHPTIEYSQVLQLLCHCGHSDADLA